MANLADNGKQSTFTGYRGRKLSNNSARKRCGIARQFFNAAKRKRLITENPFAEIQGGVAVRAIRNASSSCPVK
jgi:site-specific recombinase XerD